MSDTFFQKGMSSVFARAQILGVGRGIAAECLLAKDALLQVIKPTHGVI